MPLTTFSTDFQGRPSLDGPLGDSCLDLLRREAFPLAPPFDPNEVGTEEAPWRSFKLAPLPNHQLLISVASERGNTDHLGRPVSSATGCIVGPEDMDGPLRDIGSVWRALDVLSADEPPTHDALRTEVQRASPLCSDAAFAELAERYSARGAFHAHAAATIGGCPQVDVVLPMDVRARRHLLPVLLLVPLERLMRLHLATGSLSSDHREKVLGVERAPSRAMPDEQKSGVFGGFFSRSAPPEPVKHSPLVDFSRSRVVDGPMDTGPRWLAALGAARSDWPELTDRQRFCLLLSTGDARTLQTGPTSLFKHPAFERLRELVQELEDAEAGLRKWR